MRVADYIAQYINEKFNIDTVFMITGGGAMHLNDGFGRNESLKCVFNHHEQACAIAAEGYYRACGRVSAVNVTTGPGGLNTLTGVMGQWTDSIPVLYISGQVKYETTIHSQPQCNLRQVGDQEVDIVSVVSPLVKYAKSVNDASEIRYELDKAWDIMNKGRKGPVWLNIPMNIQGAVIDPESLEGYFANEVKSNENLSTILVQAREKLLSSEKPLIVAGHGIRLANEVESFLKLIEGSNIPVVTTFNGFDLIHEDHPNYVGRIGTLGTRAGNYALQNSDCVLFLGTRNNVRQVSYNWKSYAKNAYKIIVDIDAEELLKNTVVPDLSINADISDVFSNIGLNLSFSDHQWLQWCIEKKEKYPVLIPEMSKGPELSPYLFIDRLCDKLSAQDIIIAGNGTACVALYQAGKLKQNQRAFWNSGCATMGYAVPAAIGAAYSSDNRIIAITGDGSLQMNLQDLVTIGFNKLPVTLFVLNNNGYSSIKQTQKNFFGDPLFGCDPESGIGFPNLKFIAQSSNIEYEVLDYSNMGEVLTKKWDGPVIIEVFIDSNAIFQPKLSSRRLEDGSMVSSELEDMFPFLDSKEHKMNMNFKKV